jgi:hypothetical protein
VSEIAVLAVVVAAIGVVGFGVGIIASRRIDRWAERDEEADDGES